MDAVDKATETQLKNIETRTGKSLGELCQILGSSGLAKHGELRDMLKRDLGMGHGDANTVVHFYQKQLAAASGSAPAGTDAAIDAIYEGPKAHLRPIHDTLLEAIEGFGPFEIAPKKGYVSLRRKKQFAMVGPTTKTRVEVGINARGLGPSERLKEIPPGDMCQYKVAVTDASEVDAELLGWVQAAYESAG